MSKKRFDILDAWRSLAIVLMIVYHFLYDLALFGVITWEQMFCTPLNIMQKFICCSFILLAGASARFSRSNLRHGIIVILAGIIVAIGGAVGGQTIRFGVLHCLGACMLLWPALKRLPIWLVVLLGAAVIGLGYWFDSFYITTAWLYPLGLKTAFFSSGDYFPLAPNFGWFLLGACLGRLLYKQKVSLLPKVNENLLPLRLLRFCGRHALLIYLLHQPIITGLLMVL